MQQRAPSILDFFGSILERMASVEKPVPDPDNLEPWQYCWNIVFALAIDSYRLDGAHEPASTLKQASEALEPDGSPDAAFREFVVRRRLNRRGFVETVPGEPFQRWADKMDESGRTPQFIREACDIVRPAYPEVVEELQRQILEGRPQDCGEQDAAHGDDFRCVCWFGEVYEFTATQAACVKVLWEHWERARRQ
jgi:hypothetical protein